MGLDMYLSRKTYVGYLDREAANDIDLEFIKLGDVIINLKDLCGIEERVGYWRKANAIHKWFVDNVQGGEDNCAEYRVPEDKLQELLDVCTKVLADHSLAEELLPPQEGFFFGQTEIDKYYFQDLEQTKEIIEKALKENRGDIYYSSSW